MVAQLPWPERFAVTVIPGGSTDGVRYTVVTWLHEAKAVVLAVEEHQRLWPEQRIYDVTVEPLGRAPSDERGLVAVNRDLHDRFEF